jgi:hypothetical protein
LSVEQGEPVGPGYHWHYKVTPSPQCRSWYSAEHGVGIP